MLATTMLRATAIATALAVSAIAAPAAAQPNSAHGPYYATPSWDQTFPAKLRFVVLANMNHEAVLDRETGIVWEQSPDSSLMNYYEAQLHCIGLIKGGRRGWRLAGAPEVNSLIDDTVPFPGPKLPAGHPFSNVDGIYWLAALTQNNSTIILNTANGFMKIMLKDADGYRAWCVRGGNQSFDNND